MQGGKKPEAAGRVSRTEKACLSLLLAILFVLATAYIFISLEETPTTLMILERARDALEEVGSYSYSTTEMGSDYSIHFEGYMTEKGLTGKIKEYRVFVYQNHQELFIRDKDSQEWQEASTMGLDQIGCFMLDPGEVLDHLVQAKKSGDVQLPEERNVVQIPWGTENWGLVQAMFPGISAGTVSDLDIQVRVNVEGFLQEIELTLKLVLPDSMEEQIVRTIAMDYEKKGDEAPHIDW